MFFGTSKPVIMVAYKIQKRSHGNNFYGYGSIQTKNKNSQTTKQKKDLFEDLWEIKVRWSVLWRLDYVFRNNMHQQHVLYAVMRKFWHLYIAVEADRRHEHTLHVLEGHRAMLLLVDEKCKCVFHQVQQNTDGGTLGYPPFSPREKKKNSFE